MRIIAGLMLACQTLTPNGVGTHATAPGLSAARLRADVQAGQVSLYFYFGVGDALVRVDGDGTRTRPLRVRLPLCHGLMAVEIKVIFAKTESEYQLPEGFLPVGPGGFRPRGGFGP